MNARLGAILLDGELRDREAQKSRRRDTRLQGFDVFLEGFSRAILTDSRHGPVLFPQEALSAFSATAPAWFPSVREKVQAVPAAQPHALAGWERLLLLSMGPEMLQYAWMRAEAGRPDWPITAILHSPQPIPRIRYLFTNHLMGTLGRQDALVCPSRAARSVIKAAFEAVPASLRSTAELPMDLPVIPMGVDVDAWQGVSRTEARQALGLPEKGPILLCFGRISPTEKGELLPLLRILAPLIEQHDARLVLAGDDTSYRMAPVVRDLAGELGYGERFSIFPDVTQAEKYRLFRAADVFLAFTDSMHGGFPLTIAEAMASGLPVVASDWGSHRDWVQDGHTGRLVPTYFPADPERAVIALYSGTTQENHWEQCTAIDLPALHAAVDELLAGAGTLADMGEAAFRFARTTFDWSAVMRQYDALWQEQFARAEHASRRTTSFPTASFPQLFASYPTRLLGGFDSIAIPADAPGDEYLPALGDAPHFSRDLFRQVLQVCREEHEGVPLKELVAAVCKASSDAIRSAVVERHIGRLLKHGLLEVAGTRRPAMPDSYISTATN